MTEFKRKLRPSSAYFETGDEAAAYSLGVRRGHAEYAEHIRREVVRLQDALETTIELYNVRSAEVRRND